VIASLPLLYLGWSLFLFWRERRRVKEPYLALSVLALLVGFGVGALMIASLPIRPIMNTISLVILGYGVVSQQLFNPLRELTDELEQRVEKRTRELAQAGAQLTAIHDLGQKLVLSRNAVEIAQWVVEAAIQVLNVSTCGLWIVDREQKILTLWAHTEKSKIQKIPPIPLGSERDIIVSVVRSGEPIYLPDVSQDPRYVSRGFQARSGLYVPLRVSQQIIGVLSAESENLDGFSPADRQLVEALSNSAAITIHNARLYEETRKRAERLAVVNNIASVAGVAFHPDDLMEMIYLETVPAFHPDLFAIALCDEKTDELDFRFEVDGSVRRLPIRIPLGTGLASAVAVSRQPLLIRDLGREKDHLPTRELTKTDKNATSWLGVPMLIGDRVIGIISVQAYRPHAWDADDELLLSTVADQAAGALEKARLFQEREQRVAELAIVNEIGQVVSSTTEMDTLLETVHQQVSRLFDTTNFYLATYVEGSGEWVMAFHVEQGERQPVTRRAIGAGLTGHIIHNRQHLLFQTRNAFIAFLALHNIDPISPIASSWLGVPLIAADEVVGVMTIKDYRQENLYDTHDQALFSTIAAQVATAMGNLRLLEKARRRAQEMEAINEVGGTITSVLDLDTVLSQITDITKARFGHYFVGIALLEGDQLVFQSGSSIGESNLPFNNKGMSIPLAHKASLIAQAGRTGRPVLSIDTHDDPRYMATPELPDTRCELSLPIKAKGRVIGVLDVQSDRPLAYDQSDLALLQSLADQAGVAIQNARLYEELEQQLREQTMLFEASQSLANAPLQADEILRVAARQLAEALGDTECSFSLLVPQADTLRVMADLEFRDGVAHWYELSESFALSNYPATARVMETLEPLVVHASDPDTDLAEVAYMRDHETATLAIFPLAVKGQAIGVMELATEQERRFTPGQLNMATTLVNQVSVTLEHARLYEAMQLELIERERAEEALR
jgi:GAF domain-containing protein